LLREPIKAIMAGWMSRERSWPEQNHMPLGQDPETERMIEEIRLFLKE
jgi:hypothetical protein